MVVTKQRNPAWMVSEPLQQGHHHKTEESSMDGLRAFATRAQSHNRGIKPRWSQSLCNKGTVTKQRNPAWMVSKPLQQGHSPKTWGSSIGSQEPLQQGQSQNSRILHGWSQTQYKGIMEDGHKTEESCIYGIRTFARKAFWKTVTYWLIDWKGESCIYSNFYRVSFTNLTSSSRRMKLKIKVNLANHHSRRLCIL